jgi:hypothetical protein
MRTPADLGRFGGLSVPAIAILVPLQGTVEVKLIASTKQERQALRLDLFLNDDKALLVALAMTLAGLVNDDEGDE